MKNFQIFNPQISPLLYSFTNIQLGGDFSEGRWWFRFFGLKGTRGERNSRTRIRLRLLFRSSRKQFPPRLIRWLIVTNETTKYRSKPINIFRDGEKEREKRSMSELWLFRPAVSKINRGDGNAALFPGCV